MHFISCPHHIYLHTATSCFGGSKSCGNRINNRGKFKNNKYDVVAAGSEGRDSEFEIDEDKAREALKKLDQQLQSISDKPISPPKIRAAEVKYTREQAEIDRSTAQSTGLADGSFQVSLIVVLLIFSIFYNIVFITVIKPSIDGPDSPPTTLSTREEATKVAVLQKLPLGTGYLLEP
ncbi:hypothetical protein ACET3Z_031705 [Daucus carota]